MKVKKIIAVTTITTLAAAGLANAQTATTSEIHRNMHENAKAMLMQKHKQNVVRAKGMANKMQNHTDNKKAIEDAILSGNFTLFQQLASTTPLKNISQTTFNQLTPQFQAKKNAEDQIKSILTSAGIQVPQNGSSR